ncbi:MAG TPA: cysteine--tRNA ligase [Candidatus Limnocylindrales bacterium]|nr:cysteine--tRNA ligase [Candidatus Limnocylindrales bacterium]
MELLDTRSGERRPVPDGPVRIYVCGVTPYDTTHLGHAFTFVQFDTLVRALRWLGRPVHYVQNVTDVDDSILIRARALGVDWKRLGDEQLDRYLADMRALGVADPDRLVRATEAIPTILELAARLVERGCAYPVTGGTVFFRVRAWPTYGELSRLDRATMLAIAGQQDDADVDDPRKEDPLDFALWKGWSGRDDEPRWDSPWGPGRPGWHIECAAINLREHGPQVTIHGGGRDLLFPHHESEAAISEAATGVRPFVRLWVHSAMVRMAGEKMSKSLGNMVFVEELLPRAGAGALRLYLLSYRYRDEWDWSEAALAAARTRLDRLFEAAAGPDRDDGAREAFRAALEDDLDTPAALDALERAGGSTLRELAGVLGLRLGPSTG